MDAVKVMRSFLTKYLLLLAVNRIKVDLLREEFNTPDIYVDAFFMAVFIEVIWRTSKKKKQLQ